MSHKVVFFTGAGISVDSGIPTFQEQEGIRDKLTRDFCTDNYEEYIENIKSMKRTMDKAQPNAAHYAIAKMNCPVITMNIDGLHEKAGTKNVLAIHGRMPTWEEIENEDLRYKTGIPVLYGDAAPLYSDAYDILLDLDLHQSYVVIVGTSFYTGISEELYQLAERYATKVWIINNNASIEVPKVCEEIKRLLKGEKS